MLNEREKAKMDQSAAFLVDCLPPLWRAIYERCLTEGFTDEQAMSLVRAYVVGSQDGPRLQR